MDTERGKRGQRWLSELLELSGMAAPVSVQASPSFWEDSCWLVIDHENLAEEEIVSLIGTNGHVIDSIQYLANTVLNLGIEQDQQGAFTIDLAGYREQRYKELLTLANDAATQARDTGNEVELKALSAAERRQVHTILKEYEDLETYSRGQEPDRRLVVKLAESQP